MNSAHNQASLIKRCIIEGADSFLLKPLLMRDIENIWQYVLRRDPALFGFDEDTSREPAAERAPSSAKPAETRAEAPAPAVELPLPAYSPAPAPALAPLDHDAAQRVAGVVRDLARLQVHCGASSVAPAETARASGTGGSSSSGLSSTQAQPATEEEGDMTVCQTQ